MFCPECKAEYRPGFTRCSDCGLDLVERLDEPRIRSNNPQLSDGPELLWTGTDERTRAGIISALEAANIPYHERTDKVGPLPGWSRLVYAIFTHTRDHDGATAAVEEAARRRKKGTEEDDDAEDSDSPVPEPAANENDDDSSDVPQDYVPEDFDPDEATVEVWSGQDAATRENLVTCLRGIGIGSAIDDSAGQLRIRVTPSSEKRAIEMIRQINAALEPGT